MDLAAATWPEIGQAQPLTLLVPVGSCEQHGPHLPLDTDTRVAVAVARAAAARCDGVVVGPPVTMGASGEHQSFPGTLSIGTEALVHLLVELGRSALPAGDTPFDSVVFVNGHGGNVDAVRRAVGLLQDEARPVHAWWPTIPGCDAHAGRTETSLLLAIAPEVVAADRPVGAVGDIGDLWEAIRRGGVAAVSANGVVGDARDASAEEGRRLLEELTADLAGHLGRNLGEVGPRFDG